MMLDAGPIPREAGARGLSAGLVFPLADSSYLLQLKEMEARERET